MALSCDPDDTHDLVCQEVVEEIQTLLKCLAQVGLKIQEREYHDEMILHIRKCLKLINNKMIRMV